MTNPGNVAAGRATNRRLRGTVPSTAGVRRRGSIAPGMLAMILSVAVLSSCGGGDGGGDQPTRNATPNPADEARRPSAAGESDVNQAGAEKIRIHGDWLAAGAGAVWLTGGAEIYRLDPQTASVVATIPVPQQPCEGSAVGFGALWTATCVKPGLARIDPATNRVSDHVRLAIPDELGGEASIGAGAGGVWLVVDGPGCTTCRLARVDPRSLRVVARIPVRTGAADVRVGLGAVWVTNPEANLVHKIDPRRNRVVHTTTVDGGPRFPGVGEDGVFTFNRIDGSITRLDPRTGKKEATAPADLAGQIAEVTTGGGWVWVRASDTLLSRIDPHTNRVVERYGPSSGSGGVAVGFDAVWIAAHDIDTLWRLPLANA
jgi:virginiamycin B lyase